MRQIPSGNASTVAALTTVISPSTTFNASSRGMGRSRMFASTSSATAKNPPQTVK